ncbi:alpha/beta fold hydrolase [Streptococcus rifensis]
MTYHKEGYQTILFLSGVGDFSTKENFAPVWQNFPKDVGILTIDYPNVGGSSIQDQSSFHLQDWVEATRVVLDYYQVSDYILIAHSIAGLLALKLIETAEGCKGFLGIEPTTLAVMKGQVLYPEFERVSEQISELGTEQYFQAISKRGMSDQQHKDLWKSFAETQERHFQIGNETFQFYPSLGEKELAECKSFPANLPSIVISQAFREEEYLSSEYKTDHPLSQLILAGDSHYLHWTESQIVLDAVNTLLGR